MRYIFFGKDIEPVCEYCEHGQNTKDGKMILCIKKGIVSKEYSCKRFIYSPLKRIPRRPLKLPTMEKDDFKL